MNGPFADVESFREKKREMREHHRASGHHADQAFAAGVPSSLANRIAMSARGEEAYHAHQRRHRSVAAPHSVVQSGAENWGVAPNTARRSPRAFGTSLGTQRRHTSTRPFGHQGGGNAVGLREITNVAGNRAIRDKKSMPFQAGSITAVPARYCPPSRTCSAICPPGGGIPSEVVQPPQVAKPSQAVTDSAVAPRNAVPTVTALPAAQVDAGQEQASRRVVEAVRPDNLYRLLGVARDASVEDIEAAFRTLSIKYQQDVKPIKNELPKEHASENLMKLKQAHEVLSSPTRRERYDKVLKHVEELPAPGAVSEYAHDIFGNLFREEGLYMPRANYMESQTEINGKMRAILVDWLVEVHTKYKLRFETLYLTVNLIDRYLSRASVLRRRLQLVGVSAMLIAAKFEEIQPPEVQDFVFITDNAYTKEDILQMECDMLSTLSFQVSVPTAAHFLDRVLTEAVGQVDRLHKELARYLGELALVELRMIRYLPSQLVAAVVLLSNELLGRPGWVASMVQKTGYAEEQLRRCANELRDLWEAAPRAELQAVRRRYQSDDHLGVSRMIFGRQ